MESNISPDDEEILRFIEGAKPKIFIVGTGGKRKQHHIKIIWSWSAGRLAGSHEHGCSSFGQDKAERKILLGKKATKGLGAGSDFKVGEAAAIESKEEIRHLFNGASLVFVTCGLGGGTGTGSIATIAHEAKEAGALTVGIVTLPFSSEGRTRMRNALEGPQQAQEGDRHDDHNS